MTSKRLICTLGPSEAESQLGEWEALQAHVLSVGEIPDGVRLHFPNHLEPTVRDLAAREATCCSFLELTATRLETSFRLDVTSQHDDAAPIIALLTGAGA